MEVGEMDKKEPQVEVPWIPTTPGKPVLQKSVPICTPEGGNGAFACYEFSLGAEKISNSHDVSVPAATVADIAGENGKTCEQTTSDNLSGWTDLGSAQSLLSAVTASANSYATQLDNNNGLNDLFIPSVIHDNSGDPHGTSDYACCSKRTSQNTTLTPDNAIKMQINLEEKDRGGEEKDVSSKKLDDDGTPPNKVLCDPVIEFAAVTSPFKENHNPDEESIHYIDLNKTPQQKPKRRKIRPKVIREGKPKRSRKPVTPKPVQSKENPTGKRKYVRKKGLNKTCTPSTEVTEELTEEMPESAKMSCRRSLNFDIGARDDSSAGRENTTALLGKEDDVVIQETNSGLACDLNASVKHASNSFMSLPEDTQAPDTSSQRTRPGTKPKENPHGKRRYARRKEMKNSVPPKEVTGELTTEKRPEFDKGTIEECSVVRENATIHLSKETIVTQEMNPDLAYDVNTSMKQASQSHMSLREDTQATNTSSRRNPHGAKPKESSTSERKYVRRSALNKSSTPTEVLGELTGEMTPESAKTSCRKSLNFDIGARDESSADRENACKEIGLVMQEMDVGFAYDINISMKQAAANNYMSFPNEQTPSTSPSKNKPPGAKPKENLAGKQEFKEMSRRRSSNSDIGIKDESSACREISDVQIANVVDETPVSLAYNQDTWMEQALNSYRSLPEDTQSPSTYPSKSSLSGAKPKETPTGKRKYVRKKKLNSTATPTEKTGELTELIMPDSSTIISCGMSLNFDKGGRDESNTCRESLACDQNTLVKEALYNYMSLSENTHAPSTSLPQSSPPGAKLNANPVENKNKRKGLATAQDGNISNSQISTTGLQMVGYKRKHSGTIKCNSSMNLIGAHYNGLPSYESKFQIQFPNIQKKRRTEMRKTSNTHITSSVKKEVPLTCTQEVAKAHPCASNSNCWMYGGSAYNSIIHNAQTFDEFILTLRRVTGSSQPPAQTYDCNSLTRIRNSDAEANYNAKQLGISDWQTFGDADRPQTCIDVLAKEMLSCAKKKRSRKRRALSSSAHSNTNETQQHHNFAWGNHHLPLGKSSDIVHQVIWKSMHNVEALAEQFRQLNINTEARDLVLHVQNALVPFQGSFDPIKKQRPRPKVYLDEETDRVWKLLMLDINHHGIDGTDEDKAKWWEEERNVFRGRADSFIARMHLVQGDRRFSRWKGSVLDSVVGVFLTQNVSDHLSSSAFMSLAARFPKKSSSMCKTYHGEGTSLVVNKQVHIVEPEENTEWDVKLLNQSVYDQSSMTVDLVEHSGEKAVNSDDSCIITTSVISLTDESNSRLSESPQRNIKEHQCPMVMIEEGEEKSCHDGARKELNGIVSSQCSVISSQLSGDFSNDQNPEKIGSCSDSNSEVEDLSSTAKYNSCTSFSKLLEFVSSTKFHEVNSQRSKPTENLRDAYGQSIGMKHDNATESLTKSNVTQGTLDESIIPSSGFLKNKDESDMNRPSFQTAVSAGHVAVTPQTIVSQGHPQKQSNHMQQRFFSISGQTQDLVQKERGLDLGDHKDAVRSETNEISSAPIKLKSSGKGKEKKDNFDWDSLRIKAQAKAGKRERTENTMDSLDWDAVRCADVREIADTIKERGMNNRLAERIKDFLNRLIEEHGSIDLEWLRDVPPDQAKEYLLSVKGLGLKSVECVRLLTLHHLAFPVDTNVGRIAVRLGWVPLQPLPESLQLHLLELYPVLESIQKYLWPRLCKLDQKTLYELHYQMITFGKVFCTKSKPNCNACPMRGECRHFASAFASARLALPGPEQRSIVSTAGNSVTDQNPSVIMSQLRLSLPENTNHVEEIPQTEVSRQLQPQSEINLCQPIIEEPKTPEPECSQVSQSDMEDAFYEDSGEIPTIKLDIQEFTLNLQNYMQENMELQEGEMSKALVALNTEAASIPMPKLKNVSRLRTEHCVYELPDTHPLLEGWDTREPDDPGRYLLAIWTPGETANSIQPPESKCSSHEECGQLCNEKECFSCNSFREANSQIVRGTLLIPCRTAMRGSFPLNGTYFQVNEVFADHVSSLDPISVPRSWIWNLNRRTVYFGTSIPTIFKGLSTQEIQQCFWRGYVCVRGFDRKTRAPRPLMARLHFPASKLAKTREAKAKEKTRKDSSLGNAQGMEPNPERPELISNSNSLQGRGTA